MLEDLKQQVYEANIQLQKKDLVILTWGNVSGIDRQSGCLVIKPSGIHYSELHPEDMVVVDLEGNIIEGKYQPSSDTPTHIEIYKAFSEVGGIVHTHSLCASAWAQAGRNIPCYGTTHADYFYGQVPCTRPLTTLEVEKEYEKNTGLVIAETFKNTNPMSVPGVLCANHGVFTWGKDAKLAVENAIVLEEVAKMAYMTEMLNGSVKSISKQIQDKHYYRKHGTHAYYGQRK